MSISTLTTVALRELARRINGGLEITLYWHPDDNGTSVEVYHQATGETIAFPVPADRALDAFHHPFVHLAEQDAGAAHECNRSLQGAEGKGEDAAGRQAGDRAR